MPKLALPFNFGVDEFLPRRIQWLLFIAPSFGMLVAVGFWIWLEEPVRVWTGLPRCVGANEYGSLASYLMLLLGVPILLAGYLTGWLVNALWLSVVRRWPWPRVRAALLQSDVPSAWQQQKILSPDDLQAMRREVNAWTDQHTAGVCRVVFGKAGLGVSAGVFLCIVLSRVLRHNPALVDRSWWELAASSAVFGCAAAGLWWRWKDHVFLYQRRWFEGT